MSFTDSKFRIATEEQVNAELGGFVRGARFRCYLCGHKFVVGDYWRWVHATHKGLTNFLVCQSCDCDDVLEKWIKANEELEKRFWWILE